MNAAFINVTLLTAYTGSASWYEPQQRITVSLRPRHTSRVPLFRHSSVSAVSHVHRTYRTPPVLPCHLSLQEGCLGGPRPTDPRRRRAAIKGADTSAGPPLSAAIYRRQLRRLWRITDASCVTRSGAPNKETGHCSALHNTIVRK